MASRKRKQQSSFNDDNDNDNNKKKDNDEEGEAERDCPYLDTIQRSLLDFDFEPSCSVSLESSPHVYGCLVCGKYFRGRGSATPAYTHSVEEGHFCFVHLQKGTFYCLPDNYAFSKKDTASLADISAALHPTFIQNQIDRTIDRGDDDNPGNPITSTITEAGGAPSTTSNFLARDLFGRTYLPGFVGLNNLHKTDGINATIQALAHVRPLRNFFLKLTHKDIYIQPSSSSSSKKSKKPKPPHRISHLAMCFGELIRKMWSDQRFKSHVDPHMLIQAVSDASKKKFQVGTQVEVGEFMAWLLNQLHVGLGGNRKINSSIIYQCFQGEVEVTTRQRKLVTAATDDASGENGGTSKPIGSEAISNGVSPDIGNDNGHDPMDKMDTDDNGNNEDDEVIMEESTIDTKFLQLTLDITEKPLFRDGDGGLVIPQEPLVTVLKKFDGVSFSDALNRSGTLQRKRYQLKRLPPYLILHLARLKSNRYSTEKNPTIVAFPVKNLDLGQYTRSPEDGKDVPPTEEEARNMNVKQLKAVLAKYGRDDIAKHAVEKKDLLRDTLDFVTKSLPDLLADKYDLVANIIHEIPADVGKEGKHDPLQEGSYKCHVQHKASKQWYEMQDLHVTETMPQLIGVSESYLLIFERKSVQAR